MDYIDNVSIEPADNSSAVNIGVLIIILNIYLIFIMQIDLALIPLGVYLLLLLITVIIRFVIASYVVKIAKKLNRRPGFWAVFSFLLPPLGLIIIGLLDTKFTDDSLKTAIVECRSEYRAEKAHVKEMSYSSLEMEERQITELKDKYDLILRKKLNDLLIGIQIKEMSQGKNEDYIKYAVDYEEQDGINVDTAVTSVESFSGDLGKCPACGYKIDPEIIICPDCGITLRIK